MNMSATESVTTPTEQVVVKQELDTNETTASAKQDIEDCKVDTTMTEAAPLIEPLTKVDDATMIKTEPNDISTVKNDNDTLVKQPIDDSTNNTITTSNTLIDTQLDNTPVPPPVSEPPATSTTTAAVNCTAATVETTPPTITTNNDTPNTAPEPPITTFEEIQKQLKTTLDHVEQRNMVSGFQTLSKATGAVVDHCEQLGLTSDDHPYNAIDREQFWAGLNNCWLYALAQRHEPSSDTERLTDQHLYSLREMVVSWADKLERFGLVDYEMGWWEADILAAIDGILAINYAAAQAAAQAVVAQAAAALFGSEEVNM